MERNNLWAPWRIKYVQGLVKEPELGKENKAKQPDENECFICNNLSNPQADINNLVLWRTQNSIIMLNRFPYNNGHLLIAPNRHIPDLSTATDEELLDMTKLIRESQKAL